MASFTMQNDKASVVIDEQASEIHSFRDRATGIEYMWQGDPQFWKGRNPTLFPMVGSTWDKILHINGREYRTGNHGFTRNSLFTCTEHDDSHVVMVLKDSAPVEPRREKTVSVSSLRPASSTWSSQPDRVWAMRRLVSDSSAETKRLRSTCQVKPSCWTMPEASLRMTRGSAGDAISMPMTEVSGMMKRIRGRISRKPEVWSRSGRKPGPSLVQISVIRERISGAQQEAA